MLAERLPHSGLRHPGRAVPVLAAACRSGNPPSGSGWHPDPATVRAFRPAGRLPCSWLRQGPLRQVGPPAPEGAQPGHASAEPRHAYSRDAAVPGRVTVATRFGPFQTSTVGCLPSHARAAAMAASSVSALHAPELITSFASSSMSKL